MIIIIEGPDRTGKDTLIKNIKNEILTEPNTFIVHSTATPKFIVDKQQWAKDYYLKLFQLMEDSYTCGFNLILNRSHLGETVYGPMFRNVNSNWVFDIENRHIDLMKKVYLVMLSDDPEALMKRDDGLSLESSKRELATSNKLFKVAYINTNIKNKMIYNISQDGGFENLFPTVRSWLNNVIKN